VALRPSRGLNPCGPAPRQMNRPFRPGWRRQPARGAAAITNQISPAASRRPRAQRCRDQPYETAATTDFRFLSVGNVFQSDKTFGAGIKGKVLDSFAADLPCVRTTTPIGSCPAGHRRLTAAGPRRPAGTGQLDQLPPKSQGSAVGSVRRPSPGHPATRNGQEAPETAVRFELGTNGQVGQKRPLVPSADRALGRGSSEATASR
jgi:hypothetical protein